MGRTRTTCMRVAERDGVEEKLRRRGAGERAFGRREASGVRIEGLKSRRRIETGMVVVVGGVDGKVWGDVLTSTFGCLRYHVMIASLSKLLELFSTLLCDIYPYLKSFLVHCLDHVTISYAGRCCGW